jgi:hypothetical protein
MKVILLSILTVIALGASAGYVKNQYEEFKAGIFLEGAETGAVLGFKAGREAALKEGLCI